MLSPRALQAVQPEAYDASDPEQVAKAEAARSLRESQLRQVEAAILATPQGRMWVWSILSGDCHLWEKKIAISGQHEQGFFDGQQAIGQGLMRRLARANPELFAMMLTENDL